MPKYLIERAIPDAGKLTERDLVAIAKKSRRVLERMGPEIQWVHSYVTADAIHCVYIAANGEMIREHGRQGEFPVTRISVIENIFDPATAEKSV